MEANVNPIYFVKLSARDDTKLRIIWLHGWGATHTSMYLLAELFQNQAENYLLDLPGFGKSKKLEKPYSSLDYVKDVADFINTLPPKKTIIVGHSNGGRIAVKLLANYTKIVDGIVLLDGAGLQKKHSFIFKIYTNTVRKFSPIIKKIFPFLKNVSLGSNDYKNTSGIMRETFIKLLDENLVEDAKKIEIPTLLIYGDLDRETPLYMGQEFNKLIKNSKLHILEGGDHWSSLLDYKRQTHHFITTFIREKL